MNNNVESKHKKVIDFFNEHIKEKDIEIKSIKRIHKGLTNESYCVKTNKGRYTVRFANTETSGIDRSIEKQIYESSSGFIFFDEDGNMIRDWIYGKDIKPWWVGKKLKKVFFASNVFHTKKIQTNKKIDFKEYLSAMPDDCYKELFLELLEKYDCKCKYVISHNDLTPKNTIYKFGHITLLDYEWSKLNFEWFDYLYFLLHTHYPRYFILKNASKNMHEITAENFFFIAYFNLSWIKTINERGLKFDILKFRYERNMKIFYKKSKIDLKIEEHKRNHVSNE